MQDIVPSLPSAKVATFFSQVTSFASRIGDGRAALGDDIGIEEGANVRFVLQRDMGQTLQILLQHVFA